MKSDGIACVHPIPAHFMPVSLREESLIVNLKICRERVICVSLHFLVVLWMELCGKD